MRIDNENEKFGFSLLESNSVFQQYRNEENGRDSSSETSDDEGDAVDIHAFKDLNPIVNHPQPSPLTTEEKEIHTSVSKMTLVGDSAASPPTVTPHEREENSVTKQKSREETPLLSKSDSYEVSVSYSSSEYAEGANENIGRTSVENETSRCLAGNPAEKAVTHSFRGQPNLAANSVSGGMKAISFWETILLLQSREDFRQALPLKSLEKKKKKSFMSILSCFSTDTADRDPFPLNCGAFVLDEQDILEDLIFSDELRKQSVYNDFPPLQRVLLTIYQSVVAPNTVVPWWKRKEKYAGNDCRLTESGVIAEHDSGPSMGPCKVVWDLVGFQGSNPTTDLRSTGILGLLQLLYMIDFYPALNSQLWSLCQGNYYSNSQTGGTLPYVLVSFNITEVVVNALLKGFFGKDALLAENWKTVTDSDESYATGRMLGDSPENGFAVPEKLREGNDNGAVTYCKFSAEEATLASKHRVLTVICEFFVGCVYQFIQEWLQKARLTSARTLSVIDFPAIKEKLTERWLKKKRMRRITVSAVKARHVSPSLFS